MYWLTGHGVTVGFHRLFTHKSFKPNRAVKIALAIAGSHGDPGPGGPVGGRPPQAPQVLRPRRRPALPVALRHQPAGADQGLPARAHDVALRPRADPAAEVRPGPDEGPRPGPHLAAVPAVGRGVAPRPRGRRRTPHLVLAGRASTAFFWGSLVRVSLLHHVTWSINSICHTLGERPFVSRDKSANVWWLAIPSMGESWHNLHHADPTCARHGVLRGQVDTSARVIWFFEKLGWVNDVRWPVRSASTPSSCAAPATPRSWPDDRRSRHAPGAAPTRRSRRRSRMTAAERREQLIDDRPRPVRRARLRRYVDRGDLRARRGLQARRLRALRRQGGPLRRRRRPRGPPAAGDDAGRPHRRPAADAPRAGGAGAARLHRAVVRRLPDPGAGQPDRLRVRLVRVDHRRHRLAGGAHPRGGVHRPRLRRRRPRRCTPRCSSAWSAPLGQWWLDARQPSKEVVAAHLVNLAWHGLAGMEKNPTLRSQG